MKNQLPKIDLVLPNFTAVTFGESTIWFSYQTPVGFRTQGRSMAVCENVWSVTTGKHLSYIDGGAKKDRIPEAEFNRLLAASFSS